MAEKLTIEEFIKKAKVIHGDRFDYSKSIYVSTHEKMEIVCPEHGSFFQRPSCHLRTAIGCYKCAFSYENIIKRAGCKLTTRQEFIEKATSIHGDKYDYSKIEYRGDKIKIEIVCKLHGSFWQMAGNHINKCISRGCPKCGSGKNVSNNEVKWLQELKLPDTKEHRQVVLKVDGRRFNVDGYDSTTKTVYEFLGDYWHGNPNIYDPNSLNKRCKKTFRELYDKTIDKFTHLKNSGYNVMYIWESDFEQGNKDVKTFL